MYSITVTLEDTGASQTFEAEDRMALFIRYSDHISPANFLEGRRETTYWADPEKRKAYDAECLKNV